MVKRKPEVLAIIPARGGSKGIPRKNIRDFAGHPLIAYSIAAGLQAQQVTRVVVSTDDEEIAQVARHYGAETPFLRPAELAQDSTLDLPVFQHALAWLTANEAYAPDVVVQLRPTSPVRPVGLVDAGVQILLEHPEADSVRGVVPAGQNPHKMWRIDLSSGQMNNLLDVPGVEEPYNAPRQMLPPVYWQTGHLDVIRPATILERNSMSGGVILPVMIDARYTVDIDSQSDWARSEWLVWHGGLNMVHPGRMRRPLPAEVRLVVFDFDGVLTDNRVWVDAEGHEFIAAYRSDSLGIQALQRVGVKTLVLSTETDGSVAARCRKIGLTVIQGVREKATRLTTYLREENIDPAAVVYVGNDVNDLVCFDLVGCAVAVADAHVEVLRQADLVLSKPGGHGAVRELCDLLVRRA
ncbi:MAG: acylneuraminate cytidylyltransferase [Chloroflexota bacterium]|jgi:N-acylneuraminate cytidylyltransferase